MKEVKELLENIISNKKLIQGVISNRKKKNDPEYNKISFKLVDIKGQIQLQLEYHYDKKVKHENLSFNEGIREILSLSDLYFKQIVVFTIEADYQIFTKKKGEAKILKQKATKSMIDFSHNRKKNYVIEEGEKVPFLVKLGVMNEDGKVLKKKYDKFKQINRFLEMVSDIVPNLDTHRRLNIIDFGSGKSYLTFALYHYLVNILGRDVNIIGLDLKEDVIDLCNKLSEELNFDKNLKFIIGDIKGFQGLDKVDMVVTLHACDTATDDAIVKAVSWDADVILSVPCCQHELLNKIHNPVMRPMEKHGIIKERLSALITDSVRVNILEILGYSTQILEFIDMEHTPKNLLIRAIKRKDKSPEDINEYMDFKKFWGIEPYIETALGEKLQDIIMGKEKGK